LRFAGGGGLIGREWFGVETVGDRQFRLVLPTALGPGEYGILAVAPSESASTAGKMFTFRILM